MTASPVLVESFYLAEITVPLTVCGSVHGVLSKRMGCAFDQQQCDGTPLMIIRAYLPVMESFRFNKDLRGATSGQAFPQMIFGHWENLSGDSFEAGNKLGDLVRGVRKRKALDENVPSLDHYLDKL
jgi:elongation factor 2